MRVQYCVIVSHLHCVSLIMDEIARGYSLVARRLTREQRRQLRAVAARDNGELNAAALESLADLRLIAVRENNWYLTNVGECVLALI